MGIAKRKRIRLLKYDYAEAGAYFITICSHERKHIFGAIADVGQGLCPCRLSLTGEIVCAQIKELEKRYPHAHIDRYVIMPNHVHLLISLRSSARAEPLPYGSATEGGHASIGHIIGTLKSITTKCANHADYAPGRKLWQHRFYDHIIRNESEYREISEYIDINPLKWTQDRYYSE